MKYLSTVCGLLSVLVSTQIVVASETSGTITTGFHTTKVCHAADCSTPTPGSINLKPTGATAVTIDDGGMNGIAWGNELGWITFNPTGPQGVTVNPSTGVLSGKAWSQVGGWMNFAPTGQGVTINAHGEFVGWAWVSGPYGGWMKFDCAAASTCIKTDWRPVAARTSAMSSGGNGPVAGGGSGGSSPSDMCWNIAGIQFEIPVGMTRAGASMCETPPTDICQNLPGNQSTVPYGYIDDQNGLCFLVVDYCPNIPDAQYAVPLGYTVTSAGMCVEFSPSTALLPRGERTILSNGNTPARSEQTPSVEGTSQGEEGIEQGTVVADMCTNIPDVQSQVPVGYVTEYLGACVPEAVDYCPNIDGMQRAVPDDRYISESGTCVVFADNTTNEIVPSTGLAAQSREDAEQNTVSLWLIPERFTIPINAPTLTQIFRALTPGVGTTLIVHDNNPDNKAVPLDAVSLALGVLGVIATAAGVFYLLPLLFAALFVRHWGIVFDVASGKALAHAQIFLYDSAGTLVSEMHATDAGTYGFRVPRGTYHVRATIDGFMTDTQTGAALYDGGEINVGWSGRVRLNIPMRAISAH